MYTAGQLESFRDDYLKQVQNENMTRLSAINRMISKGGFVMPEMLANHTVFIVADGADSGAGFEVAASFLKPIKVAKKVAVVAIASEGVVNKLKKLFDEVEVASEVKDFQSIDHYFDENVLPSREEIITMTKETSTNWEHPRLPNRSIMVSKLEESKSSM